MSRNPARREAGSISVLTLLAFAAIAGAFLYVAVVGSRTAETTRVRVSADATAMAAATVKAKVLNYEAFVLLADTVLLPLANITDRIEAAEIAGLAECMLVFEWNSPGFCESKYLPHMAKTSSNQPAVNEKVTDWLDGLEELANDLQRIGPQWAEFVAVRAGESDSYKGPGAHGVTAAAAFPVPDLDGECSQLGIEMIDNNAATRDGDKTRDACHDRAFPLEEAYLFGSMDPVLWFFDQAGLASIGGSLVIGHVPCSRENQVPKLADNWKDYRVSTGLAISEHPGDKKLFGLMDALRRTKATSELDAGHLLGIACAEHYSQDHHDDDNESLWHMDWRARLVPCAFDQSDNAKSIVSCGAQNVPGSLYAGPDHVAKMQLQFEKERLLGAARYWKY